MTFHDVPFVSYQILQLPIYHLKMLEGDSHHRKKKKKPSEIVIAFDFK